MKWNKERKSWNVCGIHYINIVDISRKTDEKNGVETIVGNDGILWLNEKHIKERLMKQNKMVLMKQNNVNWNY